jgi:hypothetical protein
MLLKKMGRGAYLKADTLLLVAEPKLPVAVVVAELVNR